jgi:hypothetical protein
MLTRRFAHLLTLSQPRLVAWAVVLLALLFVASWPGEAIRAARVSELVAPAVPKEISGRDGVLDVVVHQRQTETETGAPIAGARVRAFAILDGRAHSAAEATTDAAGVAHLRGLPLAEHWIVAEAPGKARASQMVVVVAGPRRLDLALGPEHTLDVEVKDEQGAPMMGVEIEVRGPDPFPVGARTDQAGLAHVTRLGEGPFTVLAGAPGYEEVTKRRVPEGEVVHVVLGKQGALVVEVTTSDGAPVAGAQVLLASGSLGSARVAETSAEGKVRIAGLDRGSYALRATKGQLVSPIEIGVVLAKAEEKAIRLVLSPGLMITAHVVDAQSDDDVRDARVTLAEAGLSPFPLDGVTDKRGVVVLGPIAPGSATLSARADGFVPKSVVRVGNEDAPASPSTQVEIRLSRGGTVIGKITDGRGYAVDGATIRIVGTDLEGMPIDEDPSRWAFRDAMFTAQLAGPSPLVPAGELGVMPGPVPAIPHGSGPQIGLSFGSSLSPSPSRSPASDMARADPWVSGRDGMFEATPVTPGRVRALVHHPQYVEGMSDVVLVESGKQVRVDVVLQRGGLLEGRVVDAHRNPVVGAHVTALATRGSFEQVTRTGTDGSFAFAALPDDVTLLVARDEDVTSIVARATANVPEGGKQSIEITVPEPRPSLPVKVTDHRGTPLDAVQVAALSLDPAETLRVTAFTDDRGRAQLFGAKGLPVRVEVHAPGKAARILMTTTETAELVVEMMPAESVTGEVTTRRRDPIAGADLTLQTESGVKHGRTNKDGTFTLGDLSAGQARLRVRAPGFAPDERAIVVEDRGARKPTEIPRFELFEEAMVEGIVVDGRGDPIPGARVAKDAVPTYVPVGAARQGTGIVVTDGRGRFKLGELPEGLVTLEAYAADVGRTRKTDVRTRSGRTTDGVKLVITRGDPGSKEPPATGGVAVTLGETMGDEPEVVIVAVSEGSEAERAGLQANDLVVEVGGAKPASIVDARARLSGPLHDDVFVKVRRGEQILPFRVPREAVRR